VIYETWQVDAFGIRDFGSTMPVCKQPVAAFALYAFVALVELGSKEQDPVIFRMKKVRDFHRELFCNNVLTCVYFRLSSVGPQVRSFV